MSLNPNNLPIYPQNYTCSFRNPESGRVDWTTVGILPSNKKFYRVWNFRLSGVVYADPAAGPQQEALLVYDFSGVVEQSFRIVRFIKRAWPRRPAPR
jgi:hypothetical protein